MSNINFIFNRGLTNLFTPTFSSINSGDLSKNIVDSNLDTSAKTNTGTSQFIDVSLNSLVDISSIQSIVAYTKIINDINPQVSKIRYETVDNVKLNISEIQVWRDNSNIINSLSTAGTTYQFNKVKFVRTSGNNHNHISEIQIWINGTNVAPSATVTSSGDGTWSGWGGKEKINDEQHLDGSQGWHTNSPDNGNYIELTLSTKYSINVLESVVIYNRSNNPGNIIGSSIQLYDDSTLNYTSQISTGVMRYRFDGPAIVNVASFSNGISTTQIISSSGANVTVIKEPDLTIQVSSNVSTKNNLVDNDISTSYESTQNLGQYIDINLTSTNFNDIQAITIYNNTNSVEDVSYQKLTKLTLYDETSTPFIQVNSNQGSDPSYNFFKYKGPDHDSSLSKLEQIRLETTDYTNLNINEIQLWVDNSNVIQGLDFQDRVTETLTATRTVTNWNDYNGDKMNFPQSIFNGAMGSNTKTVSGLTGNLSVFNGTFTLSSSSQIYQFNNPLHRIFSASNQPNQYTDNVQSQLVFGQGKYSTTKVGQGYPYISNQTITYYQDNGTAVSVGGIWFALEFPAYVNFTRAHHYSDDWSRAGSYIGRDSNGVNRLLGTYENSWNNGGWRGINLSNSYYVNKLYLVVTKSHGSNASYFGISELFYDGSYEVSPPQNIYPSRSVITSTDSTYNDISDFSNNLNHFNLVDRSLTTIYQSEKGLGKLIDVSLNYPVDIDSIQGLVIYSDISNTENPIISKFRYETTANVQLDLSEVQLWVSNSNVLPGLLQFTSNSQNILYDTSMYGGSSNSNYTTTTGASTGTQYSPFNGGYNPNDSTLAGFLTDGTVRPSISFTRTLDKTYNTSDLIALVVIHMRSYDSTADQWVKLLLNGVEVANLQQERGNSGGTEYTYKFKFANYSSYTGEFSTTANNTQIIADGTTFTMIGPSQSHTVTTFDKTSLNVSFNQIQCNVSGRFSWVGEVQLWQNIQTNTTINLTSSSGSDLSNIVDNNLTTGFTTNQGSGEYIEYDISSSVIRLNDIQSLITYPGSTYDLSNHRMTKLTLYDDSSIPIIQLTNENQTNSSYNYYKFKGPGHDTFTNRLRNFRFISENNSDIKIDELQLWVDNSNIIPAASNIPTYHFDFRVPTPLITPVITPTYNFDFRLALQSLSVTPTHFWNFRIDKSVSTSINIQDSISNVSANFNNTTNNTSKTLSSTTGYTNTSNTEVINIDPITVQGTFSVEFYGQFLSPYNNAGTCPWFFLSKHDGTSYNHTNRLVQLKMIQNGRLTLEGSNLTATQTASSSVPTGVNIHLIGVFNNNDLTAKLYQNGQLLLQTTMTQPRETDTFNRLTLFNTPSMSRATFVNAYQVKLWNGTALSSSQVTDLYNEIDASPAVVTDSVGGLTATFNGSMSSTISDGIYLSGGDQNTAPYLSIDPFYLNDTVTIEVYFKFNETVAYGRVFEFTNGGETENFGVTRNGSNSSLGTYTPSSGFDVHQGTINNGQYHHLVITASPTGGKSYLDNSTGYTYSTDDLITPGTRNYYYLGKSTWPNNPSQSINIKYFRIWNGTALSSSQVTELYNARDVLPVIKDSVGGLTATYVNGTTSDTTNGANFDGINNYIDLQDFEFGGVCSFEVYFKFITQKNGINVVQFIHPDGTWGNATDTIDLYSTSTGFYNTIKNNNSYGIIGNQSMGSHNTTDWFHVVWTFNNGTHVQYLNNVQKLSTTGVPLRTITRDIHQLGTNSRTAFMNGYMKYFKIYQGTALSASQVSELYTNRETLFSVNDLAIDRNLSTSYSTTRDIGNFIDISLNSVVDFNQVQGIVAYSNITDNNNTIIKKIRYETTKNVELEFNQLQLWIDNSNILLDSNLSSSSGTDLSNCTDNSLNTTFITDQGIGEYVDISSNFILA